MVYVPSMSSVQKWFPRRRGMASGIVNTFFGGSAALMVFIFRQWLESLGVSSTIILTAFLTMVVGLISAQLIEFPEKLKLEMPGEGFSLTLKEALKTKVFWLVWLTWALCGGAGIGMVTHSTSISLKAGLTMGVAALTLTAFNLTNGLSRVVSGLLSDRLGRIPIMFSAYMVGGLGFLLSLSKLYPLLAFANLLAGFAFGTLFAVSAPLIMDRFGAQYYGSIFGFTFTAYGFLGSWLGPYLGGLLYDLTGSYLSTCLLFASYCFASALLILMAREKV